MKTTKNAKLAKVSVKSKVAEYTASIKVLGKVYTSTGETVTEALTNLKPEGRSAGVAIVSVSKGDQKRDKVLNHSQVFRLFSTSRLMREIALKGVCMYFSDL